MDRSQQRNFRRKVGYNKFELCDPQIHPNDNQPHYDVKSIIEDRNGQIWIGTWEQGLLRYDPINDQYYIYPNINPSQSAHTLFQDNNGNIWIGTWRYGLAKLEKPYDMNNYALKYFKHEKIVQTVFVIISYIPLPKIEILVNYGLGRVAD